MIIRKSIAEIEGMAQAGALLVETLALVGEHLEPGVTMRRARPDSRRAPCRERRDSDVEGLQGLPDGALHFAELDGRARDPE